MSPLVTGAGAAVLLAALVAGVPYGLVRAVGSPLPRRWDVNQWWHTLVTTPMTGHALITVLDCMVWALWALFVLDVARAIPEATTAARHGRRVSMHGWSPLRGLAVLLVGAVTATLTRTTPTTPTTSPAAYTRPLSTPIATAALAAPTHTAVDLHTVTDAVMVGTVTVLEPHDGIHDSLWRIAQRCLGNGSRWTEIYQLNKGLPQPGGGALDRPSLIHPGWTLRLPTPGAPAADPPPPSTAAPSSTPTTTPLPPARTVLSAPSSPSPSASTPTSPPVASPHSETPNARDDHYPAPGGSVIAIGEDLLVAAGFAAAISAALVTARWRQRRAYQPGSGRRDDLPVAPVVRSLNIAHLRTIPTSEEQPDNRDDASAEPTPSRRLSVSEPADFIGDSSAANDGLAATEVGARDSQAIAVDLAQMHGLGLLGPGASDAARALLLHRLVLSATDQECGVGDVVVTTRADAAYLLGATPLVPERLHVADDLDAALNLVEAEILQRSRLASTPATEAATGQLGTLTVMARVPDHIERLQAVLDNGSTVKVAGILLGQWRPGTSLYIDCDGTVTATNHGPGEQLRGATLFRLTAPAAGDLLRLLAEPSETLRKNDPSEPAGTDTQLLVRNWLGNKENPPEPSPHASSPAGSETSLRQLTIGDSPRHTSVKVREPTALHQSEAIPLRSGGTTLLEEPQRSDRPQKVTPTGASFRLDVLGTVHLTFIDNDSEERDLTAALTRRSLELLTLLALHPDGITRDTLADTLWPETTLDRPYNALNTAHARLRKTLTAATGQQQELVQTTPGGRWRLNPVEVDVDYWNFLDAVDTQRKPTEKTVRAEMCQRITLLYRGELADGLTAEWLDTPRESARRDTLDAVTYLARTVIDTDARQGLYLLETARTFDPYNEQIYREIMSIQHQLGQTDAVARTLAILTTMLAEIDETPNRDTVSFASRLAAGAITARAVL